MEQESQTFLPENDIFGIRDLIYISRFYGQDSRFVIAGGGNTSYKNKEKIWVKASGAALATITEEGFAVLDRSKLDPMSEKAYSPDSTEREEQVKNDLAGATLTKGRRPSVETSMHNVINYPFVVHLHPTVVNGLMCAQNAESELKRLFGEKALYIEYTDPGYVLFKKVYERIKKYRAAYNEEPQVIWLQNHGIFVAAPTIKEIQKIYSEIFQKLEQSVSPPSPTGERDTCRCTEEILPALRMMLSAQGLKTLKVRKNELIKYYYDSPEKQIDIAKPFTPDTIVYCKSKTIFLNGETPEAVLGEAQKVIPAFIEKLGYQPKVILIKGIGLVAVGDNAGQCDIILDVFEDAMKVAYLAHSFGGPHPMTQEQIDFIDNWEVENYRRSVAGGTSRGRAENKTIVITGAAQGFGEGIGRCLLQEGANIVIADLNDDAGSATAEEFNRIAKSNRAFFVKTNVTDMASLENLIHETICQFGAIDCFISNAGVLRAGGLDDMTPENFDFVTKINYNAYFYCTKMVTKVMKLQTKYARADYYADIIQINSKSGLQGSKANFAYAGGKFGGIGLTQSFALELAPYRIKVNSICPGNFYEGPLWSDPDNGLFVQYLKAGKVPGAKTIEDVKAFYLSKVPMGKGCTPEDVTRGVLYLMDQCGETGQALPITGGQVMLS
ncbi:MAG: SDR family NAD(P)-dependent oxidoreductase [Proteiniphilum sp.]|uniref:SDR family NAD(P)-dependent oxidoreductase n=1 Tax=Proteiniphilum sp. TaxID=1926877 RepID=UPI002B1F748D|nr:SDR family NAD(P)-dependent oxidoreductase [Proteiniphilum sp.]MEA5127866.1 SDR family NAD(P)-dependent oxidoreductase [Proteiniphilum sp.]